MTPVVNRLKADYDYVEVLYFNAADGAEGQALFEELGLPGHPSYVIMWENELEAYRGFGVVPEQELRDAILNGKQGLSSN